MKTKLLIATAFTALVGQTGAHATELSTDSGAYRACKQHFYRTVRDENLNIRPEQFYKLPTGDRASFHYLFNASGAGSDNGRKNYRIECEARKAGRVTSFEMEEGRWIYNKRPQAGLAAK